MKKYFALLLVILMSATLVYAHGDATHLTGTITAIEGDHIQIKDMAGKQVMVMLSKTTKYLKAEKKAATKGELKVGTRVLIDAKMDEKMKMFSASEVTIGVTTATPAKVATPKAK
jgi:uncharacterized protein YgiM (DUF1202 family)